MTIHIDSQRDLLKIILFLAIQSSGNSEDIRDPVLNNRRKDIRIEISISQKAFLFTSYSSNLRIKAVLLKDMEAKYTWHHRAKKEAGGNNGAYPNKSYRLPLIILLNALVFIFGRKIDFPQLLGFLLFYLDGELKLIRHMKDCNVCLLSTTPRFRGEPKIPFRSFPKVLVAPVSLLSRIRGYVYQHTFPGSNEISDSSHMEESRKFVIKIYFLALSVNYQIKEMPSFTRGEQDRSERVVVLNQGTELWCIGAGYQWRGVV